jgi:hypothetical protein
MLGRVSVPVEESRLSHRDGDLIGDRLRERELLGRPVTRTPTLA